ncbi:MAG: bifunctional methylenetetrahydrofolate dehydrogenase/methenyltetrahydrofolate cyclohydrolase FolD [Anaerolineae bacterium]|nr:bifunctional methylenetetrahydrofolate dehydrogenase/methenyltetrahydrofolate cyclohydrolase FolD [Anaerolineae bacterium]HPD41652.1 bifunctional methylenetetrahydrofolate dehydrogenase/methenyltetrahydrofolate cyclohydrolase FolD [Anaerolineae bacterium]HRT31112.1 bifunctional methylenetetrahydrofolate dehydrogenase/methenyltetrahydrofolate cyclohydrolase FolD [Anaerolineae bacterium]HXK41472.1 bifunctional methylenetetrahydrofolate dehydrogenase/methenyltetrahydrofolate cyclohydrolase FolD 
MTANMIDGTAIAASIQAELTAEVAELKEKHGIVPGLATVLVGDNPASQTYVKMKRKRCAEVGIYSVGRELPADAPQEQVEALVRELNADPAIHGILVQLPLPGHLDEEAVLNTISLHKDVDGFHPVNIGRLAMKGREALFAPCTPAGCIELLDRIGVEIRGKEAVVLGRSNIVGLPVSMLLLKRDATVTICHSRSQDLPAICRRADILVAAVGRAEMVRAEWVKPGAVVIDVGINRVEDPTAKRGYRLVGDVAFEEVQEVAGWITPVPGGVGPMTIAMLLQNTVKGAKRAAGLL